MRIAKPLVWSRVARRTPTSQVNLGRFQAPVYVAQRCQGMFAVKGFLFNAAAQALGFRGMDRAATPKPKAASSSEPSSSSSSAGPPAAAEAPPKVTLKAHIQQTFDESCANQLGRSAWIYGSVDNMHLQKIMVRCLFPASQWHSMYLSLWSCAAETRT